MRRATKMARGSRETSWGGVTDAAVLAATGRDWSGWIETLDDAHAEHLDHKEIARLLAGSFDIGAWWAQMLTVGYEQAKGRRVPHQKANGFSASVSRTLPLALRDVWNRWADDARREVLLEDAGIAEAIELVPPRAPPIAPLDQAPSPLGGL